MSGDDTFEVRGHIIREYEASVLFHADKAPFANNVFLPRSEIAIIQETRGVTVAMPLWLAERKGLC